MSERRIGQLSFADSLVAESSQGSATLLRINELVDWKEVENLLAGLRSGPIGAPRYPALALFKALLLQQLISRTRAPIEPLFALLKNIHRFARARYRGLARNGAAFYLAITAMNLRRWSMLNAA